MASNRLAKVFVSSPTYGIEEYRKIAAEVARTANAGRNRFEIFLFENHIIEMDSSISISENITKKFGVHCDAFIVFFKDRIGGGTREEVNVFKNRFKIENPNSKLWSGGINNAEVAEFIGELYQIGIEMPTAFSPILDSPAELRSRMTAVLYEVLFAAE
jgi:hypothetical protein